jgi:hypothetical protein
VSFVKACSCSLFIAELVVNTVELFEVHRRVVGSGFPKSIVTILTLVSSKQCDFTRRPTRGSVVARALFAVWSHRSAAGSILATSDLAS